MKIGIMGTHGIGKTTLAFRMAAMIKDLDPGENVGILPEIARTCPFSINENMTEQSQQWMFHAQIKAELECSAQYAILVCDRTVLDPLVYALYANMSELVNRKLAILAEWWQTYDHVVWLRINRHTTCHDDGFRSTSAFFQVGVDSIMEDLVRQYSLPNIIETRDTDKAIGRILDRLGYLDPARHRGGSNGP